MNYTEEEVMNIVKEALSEEATGIYVENRDYEDNEDGDIISNLDNGFMVCETSDFNIFHGAAKVVIVPVDKDYVIKMNITGIFGYEGGIWGRNPSLVAKKYDDADNIEEECILYESADNLTKRILLPNIYIGKFNNMPVYIQEKIGQVYDDYLDIYIKEEIVDSTIPKEIKTKIKTICKAIKRATNNQLKKIPFDDKFCEFMLDEYDEETFSEILAEMKKLGITSDLHTRNYGFNKYGQCIVFDYAPFNYYDTFKDLKEEETDYDD